MVKFYVCTLQSVYVHAGHWHRIPVLEISLMRISLQQKLFKVKEVQSERERTKAIAMHKLNLPADFSQAILQ